MSTFVRRPFLASKTDAAIISQPVIRGTVHVTVNGDFSAVNDAIDAGATEFQLALGTESEPRVEASFTSVTALTLLQIVDAINTAAAAYSPLPLRAYADAGVLRVEAANSGVVSSVGPAFLEVLPATAGFTDLAPLLGFAVSPHPSAKVTAGDLASTSPRAMTQGNRPLSSFIARGEDRTSESFNRALHSLSKNLDNHQAKLVSDVATPVVIEIAEGSPRFTTDPATGEITGLDLRATFGDDLDALLGFDIFVGGIDGQTASLRDISQYFCVLDNDWKEILAENDGVTSVVRIGTVAYAPVSAAPGGASTFLPDGSVDSPLATSATFDSYRNALGHASEKQGSVGVTRIIDGATIICDSAEFVTNLVEPGDIVVITGALTTSPTKNDGSYLVDAVISKTEIIVRPVSAEDLRILNESSGETLTITSSGTFENSLYLWFEPRLPRVPEGGIKLILGMKNELGVVPNDFLLVPSVGAAKNVDGWTLETLHRNLNLDGVYQGQGQGNGGGFFAKITGRPITLHMSPAAHSPAVVLSETGGSISAGNVFVAPNDVTFTTEHVGHSVFLTIGTTVYSDWRIFRLLDARTVELVPPTDEVGNTLPVGAVTSFETYSSAWNEYRAAVSVVTESANAGGFHHTKMNDSSAPGVLSFAHLEHLTSSALISDGSVLSTLGRLTGTFSSGTCTSLVDSDGDAVDLDDVWGIYPSVDGGSGVRTENSHGGKTVVSFVQNEGDDAWPGLYALYKVGSDGIEVRHLDGTVVTGPELTGEATFQLFTVRMGVGVPIFVDGEPSIAGMVVQQESDPDAPSDTQYIGLRAGWTGNGNGVLITANDPSFAALGASVGTQHVSRGYAIYVTSYAPADGIYIGISSSGSVESRGVGIQVDAKTYGNSFEDPDEGGVDLTAGNSRSAGAVVTQTGSDPAAVFLKNEEFSSASTADMRLSPSATVVVARAAQGAEPAISGVGSALEVVGSIWVRSVPADSTVGSALGGVFSEDIIGAGRYLQPIWGTDPLQHEGYSWAESTSYWLAPPTLGRPGVMLPVLESDSDPTADILEADFSLFKVPHVGILRTSLGSSLLPASKYIGCVIEITDSAHAQVGERYAIIAVSGDGTDLLFALSGAVAPDAATGMDYRLHGLRWHRSYIDIADWFQIGTWNPFKSLDQLPLIASDPSSLESRSSNDVERGVDNLNISATPWSPAVDGAGLTITDAYPSPGPTRVDAGAETEWSGDSEGPFLSTQWSKFAKEPRPPFYADGTISRPIVSGNFSISDLIQTSASLAPSASYSTILGGGIVFLTSATLSQSFLQRGRRFVWTDHLRVAVKVRGSAYGTASVTANVALVTQAGTVVASGSFTLAAYTTFDAMQLQSKTVTLSSNNVYDRASSAIAESMKDEELRVRISFPANSATPGVFLQEITTEQLTDPAYVSGHQIVAGHVLAHGFRHFNPVRGFQTLGPADAKQLDGEDYGVNFSWGKSHDGTEYSSPPTSYYRIGTQELRGGAGLIRTTGEPNLLARAFASLYLTRTTNWLDSLYTVFTTETDPGQIDLRADFVTRPSGGGSAGVNSLDEWDALDDEFTATIASPTDGNVANLTVSVQEFINKYERVLENTPLESDTDLFNNFVATREALQLQLLADEGDGAEWRAMLETFGEDYWIQPESISPMKVGPNSATIALDRPTHDPLWYYLQSHLISNESVTDTHADQDPSSFVPPGQAGFIIPVDAPHGALLTNLALSLSFLPTSEDCWGIYKDAPDAYWNSASHYSDAADLSDWEDLAGVNVELWRFNVLDIGIEQDAFAAWSDHLVEYGFGERIYHTEISLPDVSSYGQETNTATDRWAKITSDGSGGIELVSREYYGGKEYFVKINEQISLSEDSAQRVDRRQYAYAVVIRFYGGPRQYDSDTSCVIPQEIGGPNLLRGGTDSRFDESTAHYLERQPIYGDVTDAPSALAGPWGQPAGPAIHGKRVMGPRVQLSTWAGYRTARLYVPKVKFRGARVGWITDKAGDKGWG